MSDPSWTIRPADIADAHGITHVRIHAWQAAYRGILRDEFLDSLSIPEASVALKHRLEEETAGIRPPNCRLVADSSGEVIGFCVCGRKPEPPHEGEWFLYALYVHPNRQGRGVGKSLVEAAKAQGRVAGAARMVFGVFTANEASKRFYFGTGARFLEQGTFEIDERSYPTDYCAYEL